MRRPGKRCPLFSPLMYEKLQNTALKENGHVRIGQGQETVAYPENVEVPMI